MASEEYYKIMSFVIRNLLKNSYCVKEGDYLRWTCMSHGRRKKEDLKNFGSETPGK
jgi:hypothetical protein